MRYHCMEELPNARVVYGKVCKNRLVRGRFVRTKTGLLIWIKLRVDHETVFEAVDPHLRGLRKAD